MTKSIRKEKEVESEIACIGVDLGDRNSEFVVLSTSGEVLDRDKVETREAQLRGWLGQYGPTRVVIEVGTHSPWVSRLIRESGHCAVVANPRKVALIHRNKRKNNKVDAELLARLARVDETLLKPIAHRGEQSQSDLAMIRSREAMVNTRTSLINHVRGSVKSIGQRLPSCSSKVFDRDVVESIPDELAMALLPVVEQIALLNETIRGYDREIHQMIKRYPEAERLTQIRGVGELSGLAFVLTLDDPQRFHNSRAVGAYLGLAPGSSDTGEDHTPTRITREGDVLLRKLLVNCSHYILGHFGTPCDLRRHGEQIAARGGKSAKKRSVIAVARKLAVLLHRLWISGEVYDPDYNLKRIKVVETALLRNDEAVHAGV